MNKLLFIFMCLFVLTGQAMADALSDAKRADSEGDYVKAAKLYRPLAEKGNVEAQFNIGWIYDFGCINDYGQVKCVPIDYKEAGRWYRLAAAQGYAMAQSSLGWMYEDGHGAPKDYTNAVKWYRLAAEQGEINALLRLGELYEQGLGVPQDYKESAKWTRLAAEQGNSFAQSILGQMYAKGQGVPQNHIQAHMWVNIAVANEVLTGSRNLYIEQRDEIANKMTPKQITEAQELARKCTANKFKGC